MARHYSSEANKRTRMKAAVVKFNPLGKADPNQLRLGLADKK